MESKKTNTYALVGFVLGMVSFFLAFWGIVPIVGIVFSALALAKIDVEKEKGKGLAIAGLTCSIINFVFILMVILPLL